VPELHPDEKGDTCAGSYARAHGFFAGNGILVQTVTCDNAFADTNGEILRRTSPNWA